LPTTGGRGGYSSASASGERRLAAVVQVGQVERVAAVDVEVAAYVRRQPGHVGVERVCCVARTRPQLYRVGRASDRCSEFVERPADSQSGRRVHTKLVVAATEVLNEGVTGDDHVGSPVGA
jgi:hypothetical protein